MRSSQQKFEQAIQQLADDRDLDLIVDRGAANTGQIRFQREGSFATILLIRFNFQSGYASFDNLGDVMQGSSYVESDQLGKAVEAIAKSLDAHLKRLCTCGPESSGGVDDQRRPVTIRKADENCPVHGADVRAMQAEAEHRGGQ